MSLGLRVLLSQYRGVWRLRARLSDLRLRIWSSGFRVRRWVGEGAVSSATLLSITIVDMIVAASVAGLLWIIAPYTEFIPPLSSEAALRSTSRSHCGRRGCVYRLVLHGHHGRDDRRLCAHAGHGATVITGGTGRQFVHAVSCDDYLLGADSSGSKGRWRPHAFRGGSGTCSLVRGWRLRLRQTRSVGFSFIRSNHDLPPCVSEPATLAESSQSRRLSLAGTCVPRVLAPGRRAGTSNSQGSRSGLPEL